MCPRCRRPPMTPRFRIENSSVRQTSELDPHALGGQWHAWPIPMVASPSIRGETSQYNRPVWGPLLNLLGDELVGDFMWMHEVKLVTGESVHAYKHVDTRRCIHLSEGGRAYQYVDDGKYRTIPGLKAAGMALPREAAPPAGSPLSL